FDFSLGQNEQLQWKENFPFVDCIGWAPNAVILYAFLFLFVLILNMSAIHNMSYFYLYLICQGDAIEQGLRGALSEKVFADPSPYLIIFPSIVVIGCTVNKCTIILLAFIRRLFLSEVFTRLKNIVTFCVASIECPENVLYYFGHYYPVNHSFFGAKVSLSQFGLLRNLFDNGERKISVLIGITVIFMIHVFGVYWWYRNDDLLRPLFMLPPKDIPPFWHAIFVIMVNDTMVRQAAMAVKCMLLLYYKNCRGRNYRRQGQMLTLVEYLLLLYRALLPTSVWYRFFLNKEYGSLFSSLTTGLYLTFKLTSVVEKVQSFLAAVKALSRKDVHYGSYATAEQVLAAGDMHLVEYVYCILWCALEYWNGLTEGPLLLLMQQEIYMHLFTTLATCYELGEGAVVICLYIQPNSLQSFLAAENNCTCILILLSAVILCDCLFFHISTFWLLIRTREYFLDNYIA
ncbi:hypothetical protein ACJX0J_029008, partial [Zea mays]